MTLTSRKFLAEIGAGEFWLEVTAEPFFDKLGAPSWPTQVVVDQLATGKVGALRARMATTKSKYESCLALLESTGFRTLEVRTALKTAYAHKLQSLRDQHQNLVIFPLPDPKKQGAFAGWGIKVAGIWPAD